jgi:hypothetical protein
VQQDETSKDVKQAGIKSAGSLKNQEVESIHPLGVMKINAHEEFSPPKLDLGS